MDKQSDVLGDCSTKQERNDRKICVQFLDEVREGRLKVIKEDRVERCEWNERREWS